LDRDSIEISDVSRSSGIDAQGIGQFTAFIEGMTLTIRGWVVGRERLASRVEILDPEGRVVAQSPIALERLDILEKFGDLPGALRSGFSMRLEPQSSGTHELALRVVFDEGPTAALGTVRTRVTLDSPSSNASPSPWAPSGDTSERHKVLIGRDRWLFLRGDSNDTIGQLTGRVKLSADDKETLARVLAERATVVAEAGAVWLNAIVPDKETLYAEHLPDGLEPVERRPVHDFLEIAARSNAPTMYLLDELEAAKPCGDLYMRTDTHWNHRGAYVAYRAICRELSALGVRLDQVDRSSIEWWEESHHGDLGNKLYPETIESTDVRMQIKPSQGRQVYNNQIHNHGRVLVYEQDRKDRPTCLLFGQSFALGLLPFLRESFSRLVFVHTDMLIGELLVLEKPDVVLTLPIERFLIRVPDDTEAFATLHATARSKKGSLPWPPERPFD
jgi:hypothetical protein